MSPNDTNFGPLAERFFEQTLDLACVINGERVVRINARWGEVLGWTDDQLLGSPFLDFIHADDHEAMLEQLAVLYAGEPISSFEARYTTVDGDWRVISWSAIPFESGLAMASGRDVTDEHETKAALDRHDGIATTLIQLQTDYIEMGTSRAWWDRALANLLALTESEYGFIGRVEHDDKGAPYLATYVITDIAWNAWSRELYDSFAESGLEFHDPNTLLGATFTTGNAVITDDAPNDPRAGGLPAGHPPLQRYASIPLKSEDGLIGMLGIANREGGYSAKLIAEIEPLVAVLRHIIARDITTRRNAKLVFETASTAEAVRAIFDSTDMLAAMRVIDRVLMLMEPTAQADFLTLDDDQLVLIPVYRGADGARQGAGSASIDRRTCRAMTLGTAHLSAPDGDADSHCAHALPERTTICLPVYSATEEFGLLTVTIPPSTVGTPPGSEQAGARLLPRLERLATALAEITVRSNLSHLSLTDPLTGLPNRAAFIQAINRLVGVGDRQIRPFSVVLIDFDNFKPINDSLGHQAGDEVLIAVGNAMAKTLRQDDIAARIGGDEFAVLLQGRKPNQMSATAERIRAAISATKIAGAEKLTASLGAVLVEGAATSWEEIYRTADLALYAAKHEGRDRLKISEQRLGG